MTTVIVWFVIVYVATLPVRLALRHRPPAVVVIVQIPAPPQAPLTLEQELERIQARGGAR